MCTRATNANSIRRPSPTALVFRMECYNGDPNALNAAFNSVAAFEILETIEYVDESPRDGGGYSEVYLGLLYKENLDPKVAVKKLRAKTQVSFERMLFVSDYFVEAKAALKDDAAQRLAREIVVWSRLEHENVLTLIGYQLDNVKQTAHLISPWMVNGNVMSYLKDHPELGSRRRRLELLLDTLDGLTYLHVNLICHGDLKGANVLISCTGRALLCDFGLASFVEVRPGLTTSGGFKGSLRWASPEQINSDERLIDFKSDIWAWGMTALEIMTNNVPFHAIDNDAKIILSIVNGNLPSFTDYPETDPGLWTVLLNCWRPSEIRNSAMAVRRDIMQLLFLTLDEGRSRLIPREVFEEKEDTWGMGWIRKRHEDRGRGELTREVEGMEQTSNEVEEANRIINELLSLRSEIARERPFSDAVPTKPLDSPMILLDDYTTTTSSELEKDSEAVVDTNEISRLYKCPICALAFPTLRYHARHMEAHPNERLYACINPGCNQEFLDFEMLDRHVRTHVDENSWNNAHPTISTSLGLTIPRNVESRWSHRNSEAASSGSERSASSRGSRERSSGFLSRPYSANPTSSGECESINSFETTDSALSGLDLEGFSLGTTYSQFTPSETNLNSIDMDGPLRDHEKRVLITATTDGLIYRLVSLRVQGFCVALDQVRRQLYSQLLIPSQDPVCEVFLTEIGSGQMGHALWDDELTALCYYEGDTKGSLKFFVKRIQEWAFDMV